MTDGETFFDEERKDTHCSVEYIDPKALAYRITTTAKNRKYRIVKEVVTNGYEIHCLYRPLPMF